MHKYSISEIGIAAFARYMPLFLNNPVNATEKMVNAHGDILRIFLWKGQEMRMVRHPDFYQRILFDNEENYSRIKFLNQLKPLLGDGLLLSEGIEWKEQRDRLKGAFHGKILRSYDAVIGEEVNMLMSEWQGKRSVWLEEDISFLMLRIMLRTLFHVNARTDEKSMMKALKEMPFASETMGNSFPTALKYLKSLPTLAKASDSLKWLHNEADSFIELAKKHPEGTGWFLQTLLQAVDDGQIPPERVHDEICNMFFAGFDSVAVSVVWTLHELAFSTEWQNKVREEVRGLPWINSMEDVLQLSLTRRAIKEGIRLYPPAWIFLRVAMESDVIGNVHIPKGAHIMLVPCALHKNPDFWENPALYNPNRFESSLSHPFSYLPFGHGSRICIGQRIADIQSAWVLGNIIRQFKILPPKVRHPRFSVSAVLGGNQPILYNLQAV